ncbi:MAG: hypothetical protein K0U37_08945 [Gammaproteobacteria bacterium]|nr:hypothetical protein [Gammaproteobacteria bacterium]
MHSDLTARLSKYGISETRFNDEKSSLQEAGFSALEAEKLIIRESSFNTVRAVIAYSPVLIEAPHHLTRAQIVCIASHSGGSKNLEAVARYQTALMTLGFSLEQVICMASHNGGSKNLEAVARYQAALMTLGFSLEQVIRMVSHDGGSKNLEAVLEHSKMLLSSGHSRESILKIVSASGGSKKHNQKRSFCDAFGGDDFLEDIAIFGDLSEATSSPLDGTPNIEASLPRQMNPVPPSNHEEAVWSDGEDDLIPTLVTLLDEVHSAKEADVAYAVFKHSIFSSPIMPAEEGSCAYGVQASRYNNSAPGG